MSAAGAEVLVLGRDRERLERVRGELGVRAVACDLAEPGERRNLWQVVERELGGLDVLVHNAGVQFDQAVRAGLDLAAVETEIAVNLTAPIEITSLLLPLLLEGEDPVVIHLTSALAWAPSARSPVYAATKAGLEAWTHALRLQLRDTAVRVLEVVPPLVATEMTAGRQDGAVEPSFVARGVLEALERGEERRVLGKARILDAVRRLSPALARRIVATR